MVDSKNYKIFSEMLDDFVRQDVMDLHRLVKERYDTTSLEGYDLLLWGDLNTLFEPCEEDEVWRNQQGYNLISWRLFDSCGVHVLLMDNGIAIHMMIEKKYSLTQEMLSRMLNRRLEVDHESEMAFEYCKLDFRISLMDILTYNYGVLGRYGVSVPVLTKDHEGNKIQYAVSRKGNTSYSSLYGNKHILEDIKLVPYSQGNPPLRRIRTLRITSPRAIDPTRYRGMIGTLMYLTSSRPDLVFVVCMCAQYQAKPTEKHLHAIMRIFRYLRGTINMGLWYSKDSCIALTAFTDADHAGCQDTRRSTSGSMQLLGDRLVSWSSKKQKSTAISSTFLNTSPYPDVQVDNGVVELNFVRTYYQLADIFTKALGGERLAYLIDKLGMKSMSPETLKRLAEEEEE
ncbi:hypothetical protein Tco_0814532 [Tanacetum coccineum]